jgi:NtrC-family two-component system response regulator AlgB
MDILIVDDEKSIRTTTQFALESEGHYAETADSAEIALLKLKEQPYDLIFLDLRLGDDDGLEVLGRVLKAAPAQLVVIFTAHASIETAVKATQAGAFDYLEKPFAPGQLRAILAKAEKALRTRTEITRLQRTVEDLQGEVSTSRPPMRFDSADAEARAALDTLNRAAATPASILILGESGTGKSVIARYIHDHSHLADQPFVTVSCPSLSRELLESDLFGHVKGAFTGAVKDKWGKVHAADGGTLFLDEIGELPLEIQPKLLRLLQEREYERLGENNTRQAKVRVIAATNQNLEECVATGAFREDLYYRLNVISVTMPPLRARREDLVRIAAEYLEFFARQVGRKFKGFSEDAHAVLLRHGWPGNLRELRNSIERAVILARGDKIEACDLPKPTRAEEVVNGSNGGGDLVVGAEISLETLERAHIERVLEWAPNLQDAAEILGIDKATLYRKRKRFEIE